MSSKLAASLLPLFALWIAVLSAAQGGEQQIVLRDYLSQEWRNELLAYPFSAPAGACAQDSVALIGPRGPVPVQLSDVEYWPGTQWVRSAKLSFIADLPPLARDTYTVRYGDQPADRPVTDLEVVGGKDQVRLSTSKCGLRLLAGEKTYQPPASAAEVPGPVLGLRLANGAWVASSSMYGVRKITGYAARLVASGPVFGLAAVRYTFADGQSLELYVQLAAGEAQAQWSCYSSADAPQDGWRLRLTPGLDGLRLPLTGEFFNNRWNKLNETTAVELSKEPTGVITSLQPWHDWWDGQTQTEWTFDTPALGKVLTMASRAPGDWVNPLAPGTLDSWDRWKKKMIPLFHEATGEVALHVNGVKGWRKWTLGNPGESVGHRLDVVKNYALEWTPAAKSSFPHLYLSREEVAAYRAGHPVDTKQIDELVRMANTWPPEGPGENYSLPYAARAYLLTASPEVAARVKLKERFFIFLDEAVREKFDFMRSTAGLANLYDILIDSGLLTPAEQQLARARMAYVGYILADPRVWSIERGYSASNGDINLCVVLAKGLVGCLLPDHPQARAWAASAVALTKKMLTEDVGPAGEWREGPHYINVSMYAMVPFAIAAGNVGFADLFADGALKRMALFNARSYLPPDPRYSDQRTSPPDNTSGERWATPGMMARLLRKSDPELSANLEWIWLAAGASYRNDTGTLLGFEDVLLDRNLPAKAPTWGSEVNRDYVRLVHGFSTLDEHFFFAPANSNPGIWGYVGGAWSALYGYGKPLSVICGIYYGNPMSRESLLQSRVLAARDWGKRNPAAAQTETDNLTWDTCTVAVSASGCLPRQDYVRWANTITTPRHRPLSPGD